MSQKIPCTNNFKKKHVIHVQVSAELHGYIEDYRQAKKLTRAGIVRDALRYYFIMKQRLGEHRCNEERNK